MSSLYKSNVVFVQDNVVFEQVKRCLCTSLMLSLNKSNVVFVQVKCCLCTCLMSFLYKSNVVFVQVKCCLCTSQTLSLNKSNFFFVQVKCLLCVSQMSSLYKINLSLIQEYTYDLFSPLSLYLWTFHPCFIETKILHKLEWSRVSALNTKH